LKIGKIGDISDKSSTGNVSVINRKMKKIFKKYSSLAFYRVLQERKWSNVKEKNFLVILKLEEKGDR